MLATGPGIIATGESSSIAPETAIESGDFWPRIDPGNARLEMRLDGTVTPHRLRAALVEAVATVNQQLQAWADAKQAAGVATLAATTAHQIDGVSVNAIRYRRAVYCYATANLQERLRNFDTTAEGHKRADSLSDPIDDHRRDARWAVSDILGRSRSVVELI